MDPKYLHRTFAVLSFIFTLIVLLLTVQPSVSFWDPGEISAGSYLLMVPHPPGGPFWLMIGRIFSMIPFGHNIGFRINLVSVVAAAFTVMLLYLVAVKLIENYRGKHYTTVHDALFTYLPAFIGALGLGYCDTYWFNAVESNYFSFATLLYSLIVWLMMIWNERWNEKLNAIYILLMAYLIGLSAGVHLMSVLAIFAFVALVLMKRIVSDEQQFKDSAYIFLGHVLALILIAVIFWGTTAEQTPPTPEEYAAYDNKFKLVMLGVSALIVLFFRKKVFTKNSFYLPVLGGGVALAIAYPGVVKLLPMLMAKIAGTDIKIAILVLLALLAVLIYAIRYARQQSKPALFLGFMSLLLVIFGFTTYTMIIIRANQNPPMNENEPKNFEELVTYLSREQYGDFPTFKRRWTTEGHQMGIYTNYSSDLDFWWRYQMNHMMTRYFVWNFSGRESFDQDSRANAWPFNGVGNAVGKLFGIGFAGEAKDSLFAVPLVLSILGLYFHFRRDWKMASFFFMLFILMGYLTAFYQNQQESQPRERDYFYAGAYFIMAAWIGIALYEIAGWVRRKVQSESTRAAAAYGVLMLGIVFVPVRMVQVNYFTHDRSRNWLPWDHSYNLLQSCEPNAILFTNGDNDTFPLWYLQAVEGVRRDIRIACLSLLNTPWYIDELKNEEPYGAQKVAMRLSDQQIARIGPVQWEPQDVSIPVPPNIFRQYAVTDTALLRAGKITFRMNNTATFGDVKAIRVQDIMVKAIIEANNWERPIYFATTCSPDSKIGADDFLRLDGLAMRLVPMKKPAGVEFVNEPRLKAELFNVNPGFNKDFKLGFKFRGMNDSTIFYDENQQRMAQNYRNSFIRLSLYYLNTNEKEQCRHTLDLMEKTVPRKVIPVDYRYLFDIGNLYYYAGGLDEYRAIVPLVEREAKREIEENPMNVSTYYNPYRMLLEIYSNLKEYDKAIALMTDLQKYYPTDPSIKNQIETYTRLKSQADSSGAPKTGG